MKHLHWVWLVWLVELDILDVPQLQSFSLGSCSFFNIDSLEDILLPILPVVKLSDCNKTCKKLMIEDNIEYSGIYNICEYSQLETITLCDIDSKQLIVLSICDNAMLKRIVIKEKGLQNVRSLKLDSIYNIACIIRSSSTLISSNRAFFFSKHKIC